MKNIGLLVVLLHFLLSASFLLAQAPDTAWTKTIGGSSDDNGRWVQETFDGYYIITGLTKSYGAGQNDAWLMKIDATGNVSWSQTYGGSNSDYGFSVQQTSDSGYVIGGQTLSYGAGGTDATIRMGAYTGIRPSSGGKTPWPGICCYSNPA